MRSGGEASLAQLSAQAYLLSYEERSRSFEEAVERFGLSFEASEACPRVRRKDLGEGVCHLENDDASLWRTWISPACIACRKGVGSETFFVSMKCTRDCYFCFNPNQFDYEQYAISERDIVRELRVAKDAGRRYEHLAITGGEPLLHADEVLSFIATAKELYPAVYVRLYTNGDLLTGGMLERLSFAGLDEIRFSVKPPEVSKDRDCLYAKMALAVSCIPAVVVEMPVIPGTLDEMRDILLVLDKLGVKGINLLEFCFPLHNVEEFVERGFELRKNPYRILHDYWYAGGMPVAGSETECLKLLEFAHSRGLKLGVHYCSLDNKHTSQLYKQNGMFARMRGRDRYPWLSFDEGDFFLKCVRAFGISEGAAAEKMRGMLGAYDETGGRRWSFDRRSESIVLPVECLDSVRAAFPHAIYLLSYNVLSVPEDGRPLSDWVVKEVHVEALKDR